MVIGRKGRSSRYEGHVDMRRSYGVKPSGHKNDDLMVVTSYPNYNSTIKDYAVVRDPSNLSMGDIYSKIGTSNHFFHRPLYATHRQRGSSRRRSIRRLDPLGRASPRPSQALGYCFPGTLEHQHCTRGSSPRLQDGTSIPSGALEALWKKSLVNARDKHACFETPAAQHRFGDELVLEGVCLDEQQKEKRGRAGLSHMNEAGSWDF